MIFQLIISFSLIVLGSLISCYAADSSQDLYKTSKLQNLELEMQLEKSAHQLEKMRLEQSKYDAESKQREAEIKSLIAESERLSSNDEVSTREVELSSRIELVESALEELKDSVMKVQQTTEEAGEIAKTARDDAHELSIQLRRNEVGGNNQYYLYFLLITFAFFAWTVIKKPKNDMVMEYHEKYGIILIVVSMFLMFFVIIVSDGWSIHLDFVQNLMLSLRITLISRGNCTSNPSFNQFGLPIDPCSFLIDFPAKYAILMLSAITIYGFTTYIGIMPAYKMDKLDTSDKNKEIT